LQEILKYLKDRGEQLDSEIATATGISLESVRRHVSALSLRGEVMTCQSIRFNDGKKIEGVLCRIAGYIPPAAPGRKSKAHLKALASSSSSSSSS
jgi:DNA-binding transcriptional ArsR family regulator